MRPSRACPSPTQTQLSSLNLSRCLHQDFPPPPPPPPPRHRRRLARSRPSSTLSECTNPKADHCERRTSPTEHDQGIVHLLLRLNIDKNICINLNPISSFGHVHARLTPCTEHFNRAHETLIEVISRSERAYRGILVSSSQSGKAVKQGVNGEGSSKEGREGEALSSSRKSKDWAATATKRGPSSVKD